MTGHGHAHTHSLMVVEKFKNWETQNPRQLLQLGPAAINCSREQVGLLILHNAQGSCYSTTVHVQACGVTIL